MTKKLYASVKPTVYSLDERLTRLEKRIKLLESEIQAAFYEGLKEAAEFAKDVGEETEKVFLENKTGGLPSAFRAMGNLISKKLLSQVVKK